MCSFYIVVLNFEFSIIWIGNELEILGNKDKDRLFFKDPPFVFVLHNFQFAIHLDLSAFYIQMFND